MTFKDLISKLNFKHGKNFDIYVAISVDGNFVEQSRLSIIKEAFTSGTYKKYFDYEVISWYPPIENSKIISVSLRRPVYDNKEKI